MTSSIPRRIGEIVVNYDVEPEVLTTAWFTTKQAAQTAETWWHRYLSEYRTDDHPGDEWFALPSAMLSSFIGWAEPSMDQIQLARWSIQARDKQRRTYDTSLLHSIPRHPRYRETISLWTRDKDLKDN